MFEMHDWVLEQISCDWKASAVALTFKTSGLPQKLVALGVRDLHVPHRDDWGSSESVNTVEGPFEEQAGPKKLAIKMQSGDVISLVAVTYALEAI